MMVRGNLVKAILTGGLVAGACDFIYASVFYYLWSQTPPVRIWQYVASGLIGPPSFEGGYATAALGAGLHFFMALLMAAAFVIVASRLKFLARHALIFGPLYGVFLYYVMNIVVVPLSNVASPLDISNLPMVGTSIVNFTGGLLIHAFGVGLPIALFARAGLGGKAQSA